MFGARTSKERVLSRSKFFAVAAAVATLAVPAGAQASESLVTGSDPSPFPQNKQNEPGLAIDPTNPAIVAAGANEEIDNLPCAGADCNFTPGVGGSGIYFSFNGGGSWTQPTYDGFSGRDGTAGPGPIGTLPNYYENGLVSDGDPVLAYGPKPNGNGGFGYGNGARLYYANLTSSFPGGAAFKGFEAIAVSHTDDTAAAAAGDASAWSDPVLASKQSSTSFSDKEAVWADNAHSSPFFGNVYTCYTAFRSTSGPPEPIFFSRSVNGGESFQKAYHLSPAYNSNQNPGRQGCAVRTDSDGNVYAVWEDTVKKQSVFRMAISTDGGKSFGKAKVVADVTDVGQFDGVRSISFDGIAGARTSSFPSLDIANGAPSGDDAPDTIAIGWSDGSDGLNNEHALVQLSGNGGQTFTDPEAGRGGRRPTGLRVHRDLARRVRPVHGLRRVPRPVPQRHDLVAPLPGRDEALERQRDEPGRDDDARSWRDRRRSRLERERADRRVHRRLQHRRRDQRRRRVGVQ